MGVFDAADINIMTRIQEQDLAITSETLAESVSLFSFMGSAVSTLPGTVMEIASELDDEDIAEVLELGEHGDLDDDPGDIVSHGLEATREMVIALAKQTKDFFMASNSD